MTYPGESLGLPQDGPRSVASWPDRVAAAAIDAALLAGIALLARVLAPRWEGGIWTAGWLLYAVVLPWWRGVTVGKWLLRLRLVATADDLALPDQRGLTFLSTAYDRLARTVVVKA